MKVLVFGDVIVDKYIYGSSTRISPEAPVPVVNVEKIATSLGGAGLVYENLKNNDDIVEPSDVPFTTLVPAFITSELKSAFSIGFLIYIPFVIIDLVVASVLMSMGMMMLSPMMISMPFKLMLFVLVDGWSLIMGSMTSSFLMP